MTHKNRILCSGSVLSLLVFAIFKIIGFVNAGGKLTIEKMLPAIPACIEMMF